MRKPSSSGVASRGMMMLMMLAVAISAAALMAAPVVPAMGQGSDKLGFGDQVSVQVTKGNGTTTTTTTTTSTSTNSEEEEEGEEIGQSEGQPSGQLAAPNSESEQQQQQQPSGCLIATAAFGSELTPQVQFLRGFRDNHILSTQAGSSFMNVFNSWYYSFSPQVADYEREQPWLQQSVKAAIYPLLGILYVSEGGYNLAEGEGGALLAGFAASSLIGLVYMAPAAAAIVVATGKKKKKMMMAAVVGRKPLIALAIIIAASAGLTAAGVATGNAAILMPSTALFVLSSIGIGFVAALAIIARIATARKSTGD